MTWTKQVIISCDGDDCDTEAIVDQNSVRVAEKDIQEAGWEKEYQKHYCDDCQEDEE